MRGSHPERGWRKACPAGLVFLTAGLLPSPAAAQSRLEFKPSLALVQLYDDNLFSQPSAREDDLISRLSPRLGAGYRSRTLSLLARYAIDAEVFQRHPELNTARARQDGTIDLRYLPARRLEVAASAGYSETQTPGELNLITGIEAGRALARRFQASQSVLRRLGPRTKAALEHSFTRDRLSGYAANDTQTATLGLERQFGPADTGQLEYSVRRFTFSREVTTSHVLALGWSREITPMAHLELTAGPRLTGRTVGAEISAALRHRFHRGDVALAYLQTQTMVVGQSGAVTAEGVSATFTRQLLRPLRVAGGPSVFRSRSTGFSATVYRAHLDVAWRLTRKLSVTGTHYFSVQRGGLGGEHAEDISHNALLLSVAASTGS